MAKHKGIQSPHQYRPSKEGVLPAWLSLLIGLQAWAMWAALRLQIHWPHRLQIICCGEVLLPAAGIVLGVFGLRAAGYTRWLAACGIVLCLASVAFWCVMIYALARGH
jgi:hypothetical protein